MHNLSLVVAVADNGIIGRDGDLPWRLPDELRQFRALTMGHIVLMGRRTYESLPKQLDGREMWVLSRTMHDATGAVRVFDSLETALDEAGDRSVDVIGGASLYRDALPKADTVHLTRVHASPAGDTSFPEMDWSQWTASKETEHPVDSRHAHAFTRWRLTRARHADSSPAV